MTDAKLKEIKDRAARIYNQDHRDPQIIADLFKQQGEDIPALIAEIGRRSEMGALCGLAIADLEKENAQLCADLQTSTADEVRLRQENARLLEELGLTYDRLNEARTALEAKK